MSKKCVLTAVDYNGTVTLDGVKVPVEMKLKPFKTRLDNLPEGEKGIHVLVDFEKYPWGEECVSIRIDREFYSKAKEASETVAEEDI